MLNVIRKKIILLAKKNEDLAFHLKVLNMFLSKVIAKFIQDENYIRKQYKLRTGKILDLDNPVYYNEKIQWIKLYYRDPILKKLVDKYSVRDYVKEKIGEKYLIPIYGVYNSVEEIDFQLIPDQFVMKLTNGSGFNYICTNKTSQEIKKIKSRFKKWLETDFYTFGREWAYKDVRNRIICEKLLDDNSKTGLKDYKVFCFNGQPKVIQVDYNRFSNHKRNLYTTNWEYMNVSIKYDTDPNQKIDKPACLEEMLNCARLLSKGFPHVRVDFYYLDDRIYFGELTFYHGAGYVNFKPDEFEKQMGDWIDLSLFNKVYKY